MGNNKEYKKQWALKNKEQLKEKAKEYYEANKDEINQKKKAYYEANKDTINEQRRSVDKTYRENNKDKIKDIAKKSYSKNKDKKKQYREANKDKRKQYLLDNKDRINEQRRLYAKKRKAIDPLFKLTCNIRSVISQAITKQGYCKRSKTYKILGCTFEQFKQHLEAQFEAWMSWDNYGLYNGEPNYGWDIDHIKPLSSDKTEEGVIALNHYTNLKPLCSYINRDIKRNNI